MEKVISQITILGIPFDKCIYKDIEGYRFNKIYKNGEMAEVEWISIIDADTNEEVLEVHSNHCVIYFKQTNVADN